MTKKDDLDKALERDATAWAHDCTAAAERLHNLADRWRERIEHHEAKAPTLADDADEEDRAAAYNEYEATWRFMKAHQRAARLRAQLEENLATQFRALGASAEESLAYEIEGLRNENIDLREALARSENEWSALNDSHSKLSAEVFGLREKIKRLEAREEARALRDTAAG